MIDFQNTNQKRNLPEETEFWVWLSLVLGAGSPDVEQVLSKFSSPKVLHDFGKKNGFENIKFLSAGSVQRANNTSIDVAKKIIENCQKKNFQILNFQDSRYPNRLRNIYSSPIVLYVDGNVESINLDNVLTIAVVGARNCSEYAKDVAGLFSSQLAKRGVAIVSGMAVGTDSTALEEALNQNGRVVAVLGCGLDVAYPFKSLELKNKIKNSKTGCLVSEYPPGVRPFASNFPVRNRIMSGLSNGVLVVEASEKSGALVTAKIALEQGKDVFGVPNNIFFQDNFGVMELLKEGATIVTEPQDIIDQYRWQYKFDNRQYKFENTINSKIINKVANKNFDYQKSKPQETKPQETEPRETEPREKKISNINLKSKIDFEIYKQECDLEGNLKDIYFLLVDEGPQNIDSISEKLEIEISELLINLTELELGGYIKNFPGMKYGATQRS